MASTQLVERVGDSTAADLLARHDRFARDLLSTCNGREIDKSDGFLLLFERPIEAVRFAIAYQAKLREFGATVDSAMASRVGIHLFSSFSTKAVDPAVYDLYLRTSSKSYAPDELRTHIGVLEVVTQRAPHFVEAWGRLAYLRAWLHFYQPFADRAASAGLVAREAARALTIDPQSIDAMTAQLFVIPPFGRFVEADAILEHIRRAPGSGDGRRYVGWYLRTMGRIRESLEETERAYRLDALDPMSANCSRSREWPQDALRRQCRCMRTSWRACPT